MEIRICKDSKALGKSAAAHVAQVLRDCIAEQGYARIVLSTGASQFDTLSALVKEPGIAWDKVEMFHLDEYVDLPITHGASFRKYLQERFVDQIAANWPENPLGAVHFVDGTAESIEKLTAELRRLPIDIGLIGIGENGHIAFNDPPVADFADPKLVKRVKLDEICRMQQVHDGCFPDLDSVPKYALTLTVPALTSAKHLICTVPAPTKANAVKAMLEGTIGEVCPATALRRHDRALMLLDSDSASLVL